MASHAQPVIDIPQPPLNLTSASEELFGARVDIQLVNNEQVSGTLVALQGPQQCIIVNTGKSPQRHISFEKIRSVKFNITIKASQNQHPLNGRNNDVRLPEKPQLYELKYNDKKTLRGETMGWKVDEFGMHLFPGNGQGNYYRLFVPLQVLSQYQIGPVVKKVQIAPADSPLSLTAVAKNITDLKNQLENLPPQLDKPLGQFLVEEKLITSEQLETALATQRKHPNKKLGELLESSGVASTDDVHHALAMQLGLPFVRLRNFDVDTDVLNFVSEDLARQYNVMPLYRQGGHIIVAVGNPTSTETTAVLRFTTACEIDIAVATQQDIDAAINRYYGTYSDTKAMEEMQQETLKAKDTDNQAEMKRLAMDKPTVRLVNHIILDAIQRRASDIHLRPNEKDVDLLLRIHGSLIKIRTFNKVLLPAIVSRIKILGRMDIAERRLPQDGRTKFLSMGNEVDMRISIMPTINGESVVIRLLNKQEGLLDIRDLGFTDEDQQQLTHMLNKSYGMLLVTGPTGSGKSTTLYAALQEIIKQNVNIITVEDPVEYHVRGVQQIQVNTAPNYTFARALRNILRHDPDVIMVGEIRDQETAKIAVECALTGHLVLSTLHTNSAAGTIARLIEMEIEPFLLKTTLLGVLAQRLVRTSCTNCLEEELVEDSVREVLGIAPDEKFYRGAGCEHCNNTGYSGRAAVYELLMMSNNMRALISNQVSVDDIQQCALKDGMTPLTNNALQLARKKIISLREVYRVRLE